MQVEELRELDAEELSGRLKGARRELFELRFKLAVGQLDNPQQIKTVRHEIARILTIVHERLLDEQVNEAYAGAEPVATLPVVEEAPAETEEEEDTPEEVEAPADAEDEVEPQTDDEEPGDEESEGDEDEDEEEEPDEDDDDESADGEEKE